MADASGNIKLLIGAAIGAAVAVGMVMWMSPRAETVRPAAPPKAPAAAELPAVAPQAPPAVPGPAAASETGDWRGTVEVGSTAVAQPKPALAPSSRSEIAGFLDAIAAASGGEASLRSLVNATYTVDIEGRNITVQVFGTDGVIVSDPTYLLQAIWRPKSCVERRGGIERPCGFAARDIGRAAFIAHALTVLAPAQAKSTKPVRVASGVNGAAPWTSLVFTLQGTPARVVAFFDTARMQLHYGVLAWLPKDVKATPGEATDDKSVLPGLLYGGHLTVDGWRTFEGGGRLPATWCVLRDSAKPNTTGTKFDPHACTSVLHVRGVAPTAPGDKLAMPKVTDDVRVASGASYRLAVAAPATGAQILPSIDALSAAVTEKHVAVASSGMFTVVDGRVSFAVAVKPTYPGKITVLPVRPRVATGQAQMKINELVAGVAAFEKRVVAAGFTPLAGIRLVFPDTREPPSAEMLPIRVVVEVPIAD